MHFNKASKDPLFCSITFKLNSKLSKYFIAVTCSNLIACKKTQTVNKLLVSGRIPECSDCLLRSIER